jgi:hypothetical protein
MAGKVLSINDGQGTVKIVWARCSNFENSTAIMGSFVDVNLKIT